MTTIRIPLYLTIAAWAVPALVLIQFSMLAIVPLAVLVIGVAVDRRARRLLWWVLGLAAIYLTPLVIWATRSDPAPSLSKDMHPVFYVLIAVAGALVLLRVYRGGRTMAEPTGVVNRRRGGAGSR